MQAQTSEQAHAPIDSVWGFAAHLFDRVPGGSLVGLILVAAVFYGLYKAAPVALRALQSSTEAIQSSAAAFESMEAHITGALSAIKENMSKLGTHLQAFNARLVALEQRIEKALGKDDE